ncbi:uncharacterized protein LOC124137562 [Haliotis rufescens]|uniref:uncharacterized protein LOC124137562 n=1 Tax=Haliotis rufescens TaxID=6454 RepID=UPI00201E7696|nr:uncharacterized protein LOC124137562 [Haliotis rufescens]
MINHPSSSSNMATSSLPFDAPISPPSYEEAVQSPAPEIPRIEIASNDEPPPSYTEATKDDVYPSSYLPSDQPEVQSTNDLTGLIIVSIERADRPRQGRSPGLLHQTATQNRSQPRRDSSGRGSSPSDPRAQTAARKKWSVCLLGAIMGVFVVAGLIAASVLRHYPSSSHGSTNQEPTFKFDYPTVDPAILKELDNVKKDRDFLKTIFSTNKPSYYFDMFGHDTTPDPFSGWNQISKWKTEKPSTFEEEIKNLEKE